MCFFPKDLHTLWKLNRHCPGMVAAEITFSAKDSLHKPATGDRACLSLVACCEELRPEALQTAPLL